MKNIALGFVTAIAAVLLYVFVLAPYVVQPVYNTVVFARAAASYLGTPTKIKNEKGEVLNRAQFLNQLIAAEEKRQATPAPTQ